MKSLLRLAFILAGCAAMPVLLSAQAPAGSAAPAGGVGPVIGFDTELHDFGKALVGNTVNYTFQVTNSGDATLDISSVKAGCSCTVVGGSWTPHIAPHASGIIPVSVHMPSAATPILDKVVTVLSNDKTRPSIILHMRGAVWVPIEVSPPRSYFTVKPDAASVAPQVLKIVNKTDEPLTLSEPVSTSPAFSAVLTTNKPGEEFELKIFLNQTTPNANPRIPTFLQGAITITTSSTNMPVLNITAMADIQPEIRFQPAQVQLQAGPLPRALTNYISVLANTPAPLKVLDASVNVPGVDVTIKVLTPNQNYNVIVGFPQGFELKPGKKMIVSIKTDNPRYPTLEVPVLQMQPLQRRTPAPTPVALPAHP